MLNNYRHYAIVVKPVGPVCNLRCDYCYYLDKKIGNDKGLMSDDVLENYIRQVVAIHGRVEIHMQRTRRKEKERRKNQRGKKQL